MGKKNIKKVNHCIIIIIIKKKTLLQENIPNGELNVSGAAGGDAASWALGNWRAKQ